MRPPSTGRFLAPCEDAVAAAKGGFGADAMQDAITILRERHGDPLAPLRSAGLTDALVQALRIRAVDA